MMADWRHRADWPWMTRYRCSASPPAYAAAATALANALTADVTSVLVSVVSIAALLCEIEDGAIVDAADAVLGEHLQRAEVILDLRPLGWRWFEPSSNHRPNQPAADVLHAGASAVPYETVAGFVAPDSIAGCS